MTGCGFARRCPPDRRPLHHRRRALLTRDHVRGLTSATYTASLGSDGTTDRTTLTPVEQALLRKQAENL